MKRTPIVLFILLCMLGATPLLAADKWTMVQSKHFTIVGSANEGQIRRIARDLELFRAAFSRLFMVPDSSVGTTIMVFRTDAAFKPFLPVFKGKPVSVAGYFQSAQDTNYIALSAEDTQDPSVIYHEFVHSMLSDSVGDLPTWFNEGLAEYYRTFQPIGSGKTFELGIPIVEHVALLKDRHFVPLEELFTVSTDSPQYNEDDKNGIFYAESWALVHYLLLGENQKYKDLIDPLIGSLQNGTSAVKSFEDVFHMNLATFQKAFEAYVEQRQAFPAIQFTSTAALDPAKDLTSRPLSEAESELYMGDLLSHAQRFAEAEPHLKKALQLNPKLGPAHSAMGSLLVEQSKNAEALNYLKTGAELDPNNYLAHYYYAAGVWSVPKGTTRSAEQRQVARTELLKSIELAPQFVEAVEMLSRVNLSANENLSQTAALLRKARQIYPRKDSLVLATANVLSRTIERDQARTLLEYLANRSSAEKYIRQNAQEFLDYLDKQDAERRESIGPKAAGSAAMHGILTNVECTGGWSFSVRSGDNGVSTFRTNVPSSVRTVTYTDTIKTMPCGSVPEQGIPVVITFTPSAASSGEPLMIEFFGPQ